MTNFHCFQHYVHPTLQFLATLRLVTTADHLHSGPNFNSHRSVISSAEVHKIISTKPGNFRHLISSLHRWLNVAILLLRYCSTLTNLLFEHDKFPTSYKATVVVTQLLIKSGFISLPAKYRPISNLNNISVILEKLFMAHLQLHTVSCRNFNQLYSLLSFYGNCLASHTRWHLLPTRPGQANHFRFHWN